LSSFKLSSYR